MLFLSANQRPRSSLSTNQSAAGSHSALKLRENKEVGGTEREREVAQQREERMLLTTGQELGSNADLFPSDIDEIAHQTPKERSSQGSSRTVRRVKEKKNKNLNSKLRR